MDFLSFPAQHLPPRLLRFDLIEEGECHAQTEEVVITLEGDSFVTGGPDSQTRLTYTRVRQGSPPATHCERAGLPNDR